jgi:hypothetical protein
LKWVEKYRPKKQAAKSRLPKIYTVFLPILSESIPVNRLVNKRPKALRDRVAPILSRSTLKPSDNIGIKGPKIEAPNPNRRN